MQASVTLHMSAPPERVWSLVSDVTRIGTFSPETFEAEWLNGATGPAPGVHFRGHVRRNGKKWFTYWTKCTITDCVPGRDFAFGVDGPGGQPTVTWSYHFEANGDGTDVTESFQLEHTYRGSRLYEKLAGRARTRTNVDNMRATLERIRAVAEAPGTSGATD